MIKQAKRVVVWIKSDTPTEEEQKVINELGTPLVLNSRWFSSHPSEDPNAIRVYNLSGREDIDKHFADILVKEDTVIAPKVTQPQVIEPDVKPEPVETDESKEAKEDKPEASKITAPKAKVSKSKLKD